MTWVPFAAGAIGFVAGLVVGAIGARAAADRERRRKPDGLAILALLYELFNVARADGRDAVEWHVRRWRDSEIFRRHPLIAGDQIVREFVRDALVLLVEHAGDRGLDRMLTDLLRAHRHRAVPSNRAARARRARTLDCIRRSVLSMSHGATPTAAIRAGRAALGDTFATQEITSLVS